MKRKKIRFLRFGIRAIASLLRFRRKMYYGMCQKEESLNLSYKLTLKFISSRSQSPMVCHMQNDRMVFAFVTTIFKCLSSFYFTEEFLTIVFDLKRRKVLLENSGDK